jgi:Myb DNA-binding like
VDRPNEEHEGGGAEAADDDDKVESEGEDGDATPKVPALSAYCSKFRSKRRKKADGTAAAAIAANTAAAGQGEEGTAAAAATVDPVLQALPAAATAVAALDDADGEAAPALQGPVVQIVNGEIVLQPSSVVVVNGATANNGSHDVDPNQVVEVLVEEEQHLAIVGASYGSYRNLSKDHRRPQHWDASDTKIFYDALRQVGTDFNLMRSYFHDRRNRKQLKRKYQTELIKNPALVDLALHPTSKKKIGACRV